jgi:osmotically-inducible protein OsmY
MKTISRRTALQVLAGTSGLAALGLAIPLRGALTSLARGALNRPSSPRPTANTGSGGMMGSATSADMSSYMNLFDRHTQIRRSVVAITGGVKTITESDNADLSAQLKAHVSSMYGHVDQGQEVICMSNSLPVLFRNAKGYQRHMTFTAKGVAVTETSSDGQLTQAIRDHAREVSGFVQEGMPAMMKGMMGGN